MRIGIFGGSFDPIHIGHLWIAMAAIEQLRLDELRIVPAAQSPLKAPGVHAPAEARLEMLQLAVGGTPELVIDDCELRRGGVSYTVDTLLAMQEAQPGNEWFVVMGADSLATIAQWHQPEQLLSLATPAVVHRGGAPAVDFLVLQGLADDATLARCRAAEITMPQIELSSSELRERVAAGRSVRFRTPRAVEAYIEANGLYR